MKQLLLFLLLLPSMLYAQYEIGHTTISFIDASRNDRVVTTEIFYPSDTEGVDMPMTSGVFSTIVFGHDVSIDYTHYQNIWEDVVPGYFVMAFVQTEMSSTPNHDEYAKDLSFVVDAMQDEGVNNSSLFYNHLNSKQAIVGHGMGGGCAWLAAAENNDVDAVVALAPQETMPSAIAATSNVGMPAMIISGSADIVTPPSVHHQPLFDNTASYCKVYVSLVGGSHCGFLNSDSECTLNEPNPTPMSASVQQFRTNGIVFSWLYYQCSNTVQGLIFLANSLDFDDLEFQGNPCDDTNAIAGPAASEFGVYPNPTKDLLSISGISLIDKSTVKITDTTGRLVMTEYNKQQIDVAHLPSGIYFVEISTDESRAVLRFVKE